MEFKTFHTDWTHWRTADYEKLQPVEQFPGARLLGFGKVTVQQRDNTNEKHSALDWLEGSFSSSTDIEGSIYHSGRRLFERNDVTSGFGGKFEKTKTKKTGSKSSWNEHLFDQRRHGRTRRVLNATCVGQINFGRWYREHYATSTCAPFLTVHPGNEQSKYMFLYTHTVIKIHARPVKVDEQLMLHWAGLRVERVGLPSKDKPVLLSRYVHNCWSEQGTGAWQTHKNKISLRQNEDLFRLESTGLRPEERTQKAILKSSRKKRKEKMEVDEAEKVTSV